MDQGHRCSAGVGALPRHLHRHRARLDRLHAERPVDAGQGRQAVGGGQVGDAAADGRGGRRQPCLQPRFLAEPPARRAPHSARCHGPPPPPGAGGPPPAPAGRAPPPPPTPPPPPSPPPPPAGAGGPSPLSVGAARDGARKRGIELLAPSDDLKASLAAFNKASIANLPKAAMAARKIADPSDLIRAYLGLEAKWKGLLQGVDRGDEDAVFKVLDDNLYSQIDASRFGL